MSATANPILAFRAELEAAASRRIGARRRRLIVFAVFALGALLTGLSIAAIGWLTGEPAPPAVVSNFQAYTPQLGFHPEPGKAVFVASDGVIKLYATTNREGTYCIVVDEPWKHADAGDGGVCVPKAKAAEPITAGFVGSSAVSPDGSSTWVIAGRVDSAEARTIRFEDPTGARVERPIGSSGFYVTAGRSKFLFPVATPEGLRCPRKDWEPTFIALGSDGQPLLESKITLVQVDKRHCVSGGEVTPHGPYSRRP